MSVEPCQLVEEVFYTPILESVQLRSLASRCQLRVGEALLNSAILDSSEMDDLVFVSLVQHTHRISVLVPVCCPHFRRVLGHASKY